MGDSILWKYWLWWAVFASPALPLAMAWRRLRKGSHDATVLDIAPLLLASISTLWFDGVVANWHFMGPFYSRRHYAVIGGNLIVDFLCLLASVISGRSPVTRAQRLAVALGCGMLSLEWVWIGIINR